MIKLLLLVGTSIIAVNCQFPWISRNLVEETKNDFEQERITNGANAIPHEAPFIVSLQARFESQNIAESYHFCGGSIVRENWVVSAAHCLIDLPIPGVVAEVDAGRHNLALSEATTAQRRPLQQFWLHENYVPVVAAPFDIALIHFDEPLTWTTFVAPIRLPVPGYVHYGMGDLYGWGLLNYTTQTATTILQTVVQPIIPFLTCESAVGGPGATPLHETNVCAGPLFGNIASCINDSGGPFVQYVSGYRELVAVISWGWLPCGELGLPSIYVGMAPFTNWAETIMNQIDSKLNEVKGIN